MSRRAVILAGGKGTRLWPYTIVLPKPLVPVGDYPILEVIVRQLVRHGFTHITLAVNHLAEIIKAFFMDGSKWGTKIDYSLEDRPLGTMGPLGRIADLPEDFLVMNGDILTDLNYAAFHDNHVFERNLFTVSSYLREQVVDYGVLVPDGSGHLREFTEKPRMHYEVSMGVYMVNHMALAHIPAGGNYGFDTLMLDLIAAKKPARVERFDGYWLDVGRPEDYARAIDEFDSLKQRFLGE
ncbi:MAG: nucleotidyltransferase family protein [Nitrospira sp.]|jgi:NDP-sugar pyrophosphorylase family protein|nr:nucleotidyltransferase family protein [Nitrospira sp.]